MPPVESPIYAHPNFNLVRVRMHVPTQRGLGVSTFTGTRVRRSRYLPFYGPKVEGRLKEPGVGSDQTDKRQENRLILIVTVEPIELPGDI
ncbi:hypothetical protein CRG98_039158 [Punica granatum]|uniref:Uncharacterized protein n=1 Tax=Punica granatum TaxID=22663 RepID=A0A2I0I8X2_PUNGR|nr:hypothetical protein CRG98_039158 [Punica granatum]